MALEAERDEADEIKVKMQKRGWYVRVEHNIWGNTYIWIRRK